MLIKAIKILLLLIPFMVEAQVIIAPNVYTAAGGGATSRVAGDSIRFIYSDLTDGTVTTGEWEDQISGRTFTVTGTPSKGLTGITLDGSDGFYNDEPDYTVPTTGVFIEAVVYIPDTSVIGSTAFLFSINDGSHSLTLVFRNAKLVTAWDATKLEVYESTPFHNSTVHVIAARNGTNDSLWINGSPVAPIASALTGTSGDQDYIHAGQYDAGGDYLPNLSRILFLAVNPKFPTDAEADQNYTWWTEQ